MGLKVTELNDPPKFDLWYHYSDDVLFGGNWKTRQEAKDAGLKFMEAHPSVLQFTITMIQEVAVCLR